MQITLPPRSLKSFLVSVVFPAFVLGLDPTRRFICVSYSQDIANKHARDFRKIVSASWYRALFPKMVASKDTEELLETTAGGSRMATSIDGSLTGFGGHCIIVDDPIPAQDRNSRSARDKVNGFYSGTLYSRLDNKLTGVIIVVMQRLHEDDLVGYLKKKKGGRWFELKLPAIAVEDETIPIGDGKFHHRKTGEILHPGRESAASLEETRAEIGPTDFAAQQQQDPMPATGDVIKLEGLRTYPTLPPKGSGIDVQSWDTAMKGAAANDYSVCTTWRVVNGRIYLVDVYRRQCEYLELVRAAVAQFETHRPDIVLIEDHGSGTILIQELRTKHSIRALARKPVGDKLVRLMSALPAFDRGDVHLPAEAPWREEYLRELLGFPDNTKHDDQVDSTSQFFTWLQGWSKPEFKLHFCDDDDDGSSGGGAPFGFPWL